MDQQSSGQQWDQSPYIQSVKHHNMNPNYQSMPDLQRAGNSIVSAGPSSGAMRAQDMKNQETNLRKNQYAEELKAQMAEKQNQKVVDRQGKNVQDMDYLQEFYDYNPFGRGGGGAPLRDQFGNVITTRKPQHRNEMTRLHLNRKTGPSVATRAKSRHSGTRGATSHANHVDYQQNEDFFGKQSNEQPGFNNSLGVDFSKPTAAGIQNPDFQPDYFVAPLPKPVPKNDQEPDYYVEPRGGDKPKEHVVYDYSLWLTELLNLLYYERMLREDEDRRRREHMLLEEERLRREKDDLDFRYQKELKERQRNYEQLQENQLNKLQDFWEDLHDEEMTKWEDLMKTRPMVQYVERDDTLKLSQSLVDHLQRAIRNELDKIKSNIDMNEVDLTSQITALKHENFNADRERMSTLVELEQMNKILDDNKKFDGIRSKYVYQTLLWDKLLDHRLFQNKSIKDMPHLLDAKSAYLKPLEKDKYRLANPMEVPDRPGDQGFSGINVDKLNAKRLSQKNEERLNYYQHTIKQPEFELDFLDKEIRKSNKKFEDSQNAPSRYGGLSIGDHQRNYSSTLKY